jgi:hypothetical protein
MDFELIAMLMQTLVDCFDLNLMLNQQVLDQELDIFYNSMDVL